MKKPMRQEFADTMLEVGQKDPNLIVLIGDISHFILQPFAKACPGRFYNVGICEPTIVNMAAGLAKIGFFPVVHTISPFIVERSFEQLKLDFGYQKLGVNIITVGSAFDYSTHGCTHHCYDDFALLKNVDRMQIIYPASPAEFNVLFKQTYNNGFPTYFRIPQAQHDVDFRRAEIKFGKGIKIKNGGDLTIIALGPQLKNAMEAIKPLKALGVDAEILYLHTVKPFDDKLISKSLRKTKKCLVVEEHSIYGGLYDDILRSFHHKIEDLKCSGLNIGGSYIHAYGTYEELCDMHDLSIEGIIKKVKKELMC